MSIATVRTALQEFNAAIDGVKRAPIEQQTVINSADCPFVLAWPEQAEWTRHSGAWSEVRRTWLISVYVKPLAQGRGIDDGYVKACELLEAFGQAYMSDDGLTLSGAVAHVTDVTDEGVMVGEFAGVKYHGFKLRAVVTEKRSL